MKTEYMCFKREGVISILSVRHLKLVDKFIWLDDNISSIESDVNIHLVKAWTARGELQKNAMYYFERFLEATPCKTTAVRPPSIPQTDREQDMRDPAGEARANS